MKNTDLIRNGVPNSAAYLLVVGYIALTIIRPWEILFPWLGAFRFELLYYIVMLFAVFLAKRKSSIASGQSLLVALFGIVLLVGALFSINPAASWDTYYIYLTVLIFYYLLMVVINTPYELVFAVVVYIVSMFLYLGKSQWEYWVHGQHRYDMGVVRMTGIESSYGGPNALAMSIVVSLPFLVFLWTNRRDIARFFPGKWGKRYILMLKGYAFLACSSVLMTNSRSGLVGLLFFFLLVLARLKSVAKKIGLIALLICLSGVVWLVLPVENQERIISIWSSDVGPANAKVSAQGRVEGMEAGIAMFEENVLFGVGVGNFGEYRKEKIDGISLQAHNLLGQALGETGLVGTGAFILMVGCTLLNCRRVRTASGSASIDQELWREFSYACRNSVLLLLLLGIFGHNLLRYNWLWVAAFSAKSLYLLGKGKVLEVGYVDCANMEKSGREKIS